MADNHTSRTITVDGGLSPCEHYSYEENYGTIYSDVFDKKILERWSSKRKYDLKCVDCPLFPTCELLSCCPAIAKCEYGYDYYITERVKRAVSNIGGSK
jgi:radical SAM protein with 4Fe4S-binding SPASM domain